MAQFDAESVSAFRFVGHDWDDAQATALLRYALDDITFEERVEYGDAAAERFGTGTPAFAACLRYLHLAAGVSYWKAAAPSRAVVPDGLAPAEHSFVTALYDHGMREFATVNALPIPTGPDFGSPAAERRAPGPAALPDRAVLPLGGGKDSVVAVAALAHRNPLLLTVNGNPTSRAVAARAGLDYVQVTRRLAPELFELNRRGARNGHVPITAIVSLIAAAGAFIHGYDTVVMANERSAAAPTRVVGGHEVNHQWSKGLRFEQELGALLAGLGISYFSLLRPYSELAVGRAVAGLTEYHDVFQSCNVNFRFDGTGPHRWCGNCPKCRFVFLMMAPFVDRDALVAIFGADLLADPVQIGGYEALIDTGERRPFECIGEPAEIMAAFTLLGPGWRDAAVVAELLPRARRGVAGVDVDALFAASPDHAVPGPYLEAIDRLMSAAAARAPR